MLPSNTGYINTGKQVSKGTAVTPAISIPFLNESFHVDMDIQYQREDQNNIDNQIKMSNNNKFGMSMYARPNMVAYMLAYMLGKDTITGAGDPYTHTLTQSQEVDTWLTFDRKLDIGKVERYYDAKISEFTISGNAGQPITISVGGDSVNAVLRTTESATTYETRRPFIFYDGAGRFNTLGGVTQNIKSFSIKGKFDHRGGLKDDQFQTLDFPKYQLDLDVAFTLYTSSITNFKNVNYFGGATPNESVYTGSVDIDCKYTENVADDRQLKITIPAVSYKPLTGYQLNPNPNTITESIAGVVKKLATTEMITVTIKNSIGSAIV